ncbi:MAG: hypothetical protein KDK50_05655 [Chlamydiia bacterium]|nr:hypothetical protein [Chlamydiia bacterium]
MAEEARDFKLALKLYEEYIYTCERPELELIVNLLCIYFEAQDLGFAQEQKISGDVMAECYDKMQQLIKISKSLYPDSVKLRFWINYVKYFYFGEEPYDVLDEKLYTNQTETLDPYFAFSDYKNKYVNEINQLKKEVEEGRTFRERLIKPIITAS